MATSIDLDHRQNFKAIFPDIRQWRAASTLYLKRRGRRQAHIRDRVLLAKHDRSADEEHSFLSYRTSQYKLHYYETPTNTKFVMLTDTKSGSMRIALQQIYVNCYVEYVVKNPLSPVEHPGGIGVNNELFEASLEQFVDRVLNAP
ncbi:transporter particle subunit bet5 [Fonsecaea multimorphosa]|nr:transporter particle subunit bet5 [Fonsecaea multimorphosa]